MKTLILTLFLVLGLVCRAQTQAVDVVFDATGQTLGANATTTVLTNSMRSTGPTVAYVGANANALVVDNTYYPRPYYKFKVGANTYDLTGVVGFKFDHQYYSNEAKVNVGTVYGPVSFFMIFATTINFPVGGGTNSRVDVAVISTDTGKAMYDNFFVGYQNARSAHRAETTLISVSATGANVATFPAPYLYAVTGIMTPGNPANGKVRVYDPLTWAYLGESARDSDLVNYVNYVMFGSDAGVSSQWTGTYSYFYCFTIDLSGKFPLGVPEVPGQPTSLTVGTVTSTSVALSWTNVDTKFQSIQILAAEHGNSLAVVGSTNSDSASTFTVTGLRPGVQYDFAVRGHNISFDGTASSTVSATTTAVTTTPAQNRTPAALMAQ